MEWTSALSSSSTVLRPSRRSTHSCYSRTWWSCVITFYLRVEGQETEYYACGLRHYAFYPFALYPEQYKYNIRVNGLHIYKHVKVGTLIISPPLPMPTSVTGSPGTGHRLPVPVSTRINEQEVEQAGCCLNFEGNSWLIRDKIVHT